MTEQTALTQVHAYIKEHYASGNVLCPKQVHKQMPWLTYSSVSATFHKLFKEERATRTKFSRSFLYTVLPAMFERRGHEERAGTIGRKCPGRKKNAGKTVTRRIVVPERTRKDIIQEEIQMYLDEIKTLTAELATL